MEGIENFFPTVLGSFSSNYYPMAALFHTVVHFLVVKLAFDIITLLVITDPIILLRNTDVKEAFHNLTKPFVDFCHKNLQRKEQDI